MVQPQQPLWREQPALCGNDARKSRKGKGLLASRLVRFDLVQANLVVKTKSVRNGFGASCCDKCRATGFKLLGFANDGVDYATVVKKCSNCHRVYRHHVDLKMLERCETVLLAGKTDFVNYRELNNAYYDLI